MLEEEGERDQRKGQTRNERQEKREIEGKGRRTSE